MLNANRFKLGVFVIVGVALILVALLIHGLGNVFEEKFELFTIFDESVQGLEVGSDVKFKGVKLGNVSNIEIYEEKYIKVSMEVTLGSGKSKERQIATKGMTDQKKRQEAFKFIQKEIEKGLVCKLTMAGITGMKFVEFSHNSNEKLLVKLDGIEDPAYIPSSKGLLTGTMLSLNEAISKIAEMDFKGISDELKNALKSVKGTLHNPQINSALNDISAVAKDVRTIMSAISQSLNPKTIERTLTNIDNSFAEIKTLASTMNEEIKKIKLEKLSEDTSQALSSVRGAVKQFDKSLFAIEKEFNQTLREVQGLSKEIVRLKEDFTLYGNNLGKESKALKGNLEQVMAKLESTLTSIEAFFEMLENDPASLIHGKAAKE